jgi:putative tryptophan/tyrosine transport system substrate-binding protein
MRLIGLAVVLTLSLFAAPRAAEAQPAAKVWRIGYLTPAEIPRAPLIEALRELGYVEGQTLRLEVRSAENDLGRLPQLAVALVHAKVDVIVAVSPPAIRAASQATRATPIVMAFWGGEGLIESGIVASFARPGANVTGVYMLAAELDAKRLELLLEAMPNAKRVAVLNPGLGWGAFTEVRRVAQAAKIQLHMTNVPSSTGYEPAFEAMAKEQVDALLVPSFPRFYREHQRIIEMTARRRIAAMYEWGEIARAGGLMAYGPVFAELNRRVASYVDKILRGTKPADLPIEQPTKFELVINLKTANALGLTIPQTLLLRADEVIQ